MSVISKTFVCPNLASQADEMLLGEALATCPGIESIEMDHVDHTVFVTVSNEDSLRGVEATLRDSGFPPEE